MISGNAVSLESQVNGYLPIDMLEHAAKAGNTCLRVNASSVHWIFYIISGKIVFGSNSIDCFERLDRHLRRLKHEAPSLPQNISSQLRLNFEADFPNFEDRNIPIVADYRAICHLATTKLESINIQKLLARMTLEVLEMFLALPDSQYPTKIESLKLNKIFCNLKIEDAIKVISNRIARWESLAPAIQSPYQIPYVASEATACKYISPDAVKKLHKTLRGFNFRQLGALHNQEDFAIAKKLYPLIRNGAIYLREPIAPFNLLPLINRKNVNSKQLETENEVVNTDQVSGLVSSFGANEPPKKIVCVDDSQAMLNEIERLLEGNQFIIHAINDSGKALLKMASIKPDLVLLDVGMPNVDGYKLCTLIRKTSMLKDIPVVMVTGNKGLIDRAKAKLVGATDFLAKPFTQEELLKFVFRYLT
jgi:two-component system, chemotaxis family, response regulator PixG